jgi:chromosome segregation ATPase
MAGKTRRWPVLVLLVISFGVLITLGVSLFQVRAERTRLQGENTALNEKLVLLQKKYKEEKARVGGLQRAKSALEGQKRTLQKELAALKEENASLLVKRGASEKALRHRVASLSTRVDELSKELSELQAAHEALGKEYTQAKKDYADKLAKLTADNQILEAELTRQKQRLARCNVNNKELCVLVDELLAKYESKGVVTSILQKEPFTQLEKAEVEKLVQEYQDKKSDHSLERFQEQTPE